MATNCGYTRSESLSPKIAYAIMSYGMRHGSFTGKKPSNYILDKVCDYKNARRIINGLISGN